MDTVILQFKVLALTAAVILAMYGLQVGAWKIIDILKGGKHNERQ